MKKTVTVATAEQVEIVLQKLEIIENQYDEICRAAREDLIIRQQVGQELVNIEQLIRSVLTVMSNHYGPQSPIVLCSCPKDVLIS